MGTNRMEAFSDGVVAIIITLTVFSIETPSGASWSYLATTAPAILTFAMSFVHLAIYWNNHHHLLHVAENVSGFSLWANMHLLFWLSLFPFVTSWLWGSGFSPVPVAAYGVVLLGAAAAHQILQASLMRRSMGNGRLRDAIGADWKGRGSILGYLIAVAVSLKFPAVSIFIYAGVAILWLVPDRRMESA